MATKKKVKKVTTKKTRLQELSNDELFDYIKLKKSIKKNKTTKKNLSLLSNDELYDYIKSKKKINKKSTGKVIDKDKLSYKITNEVVNEEYKTKKAKKGKITEKKDVSYKITDEIVSKEKEKKKINKKDPYKDLDGQELLQKVKEDYLNGKFKPRKKLKIFPLIFIIFIIAIIIIVLFTTFHKKQFKPIIIKIDKINTNEVEKMNNECLKKDIVKQYAENNSQIEVANELKYIQDTYKASIFYQNIEDSFSFKYDEQKVYYAASTIKALDALYIYSKAEKGNIDLNTTLKYEKKYQRSSSKYMSKIKYGSNVKLRDLVKYAIIASDNSAHEMLIDYIGPNTLKKYGQSLGASPTISDVDHFGNITTTDAIIYMKELYNIFENTQNGKELKNFFLEADQNGLELENIKAAHKYGEYSSYYHDYGIVYDKNPYIVAILTLEGKKNFVDIVKDINKHIYKVHQTYYKNKNSICHTIIELQYK